MTILSRHINVSAILVRRGPETKDQDSEERKKRDGDIHRINSFFFFFFSLSLLPFSSEDSILCVKKEGKEGKKERKTYGHLK